MDKNKTLLMKAAALTGIRELEIIEKNIPVIRKSDDVLIRIKSVGVCGSDIHYYNEGNIGSQIVKYPWVVGHEAAGEVVSVGEGVNSLKPGDRIAIEPTIWCGECEQCKQGRKHTCVNQRFLGCPGQIEGCVSDFFIMPERCCFKVSAKMPYELAVFAEPLSIGIYALELYNKNITDSKIGILGAGPIGQSVLAACIKSKAKSIYVTDKLDYRNDLAKKMGAVWTGNPDKKDIVEEIRQLEPNSLDVVFECCGKQEAVDQAIELLKPGGTLMMVGIPEEDRISVKMDLMRRKEICFQNVRRQNECFFKAIQMIDSEPEYFQNLITHKFKLKDALQGFELVRKYRDDVMKVVIEP